ncbi:tail tape measure protein [Sphingopyxis fribergensis]|jgi:phage-related minor tail protein
MGDEVDEMLVAVRADTGAFRRDIAALRGELESSLGSGADAGGRAIERALSRAIVSGKMGFEDLKRLALSVMADIARAAISNGIGAATGGGSGGGGSGGGLLSIAMALFGAPGRATGGPVSAGRAYRVGERGPELFVPTASGRVEAAGAGGVRNIAITVNVRGEAGSEPQRLAQTGRQLARAVRRAVAAGDD